MGRQTQDCASYIPPRILSSVYDARCVSPNSETSVTLASSHIVSRFVTRDGAAQ